MMMSTASVLLFGMFVSLVSMPAAIDPVDMGSKAPYASQSSNNSFASQCNPIFLSTLVRHGSRTASSESKYLGPQIYLQEAADRGLLKAEGKAVLSWSQQLHDVIETKGYDWGGLTSIGHKEHFDLGVRTFQRFWHLFEGSLMNVAVESTNVQRTQDSRDMFLKGMISRGANQSIFHISDPLECDVSSVESMLKYAELRFFDVCPRYLSYTNHNPFQAQYDEAALKHLSTPVAIIHENLFEDSFTTSKSPEDRASFTNDFYGYSCATQVDTENIYSEMCASISTESGQALSYISDLQDYIDKGPVEGYPIVTGMSCLLIESVLSDISTATSGPDSNMSAHLRFAHAETLIPVLGALGLVSEDPFIYSDGDYTQRQFNLYYHSPMAANIMFVVVDCGAEIDENSATDIPSAYYVQLMHNEAFVSFPGCVDKDGVERELCPIDEAIRLLSPQACNSSGFTSICGGLVCADNL